MKTQQDKTPRLGLAGLAWLVLCLAALPIAAQMPTGVDDNEPGVMEPVNSYLEGRVIRVPNTDQTKDDVTQNLVHGEIVLGDALGDLSLTGHEIERVESPNDDLRRGLSDLLDAASVNDTGGMDAAADELLDILFGRTEGRIYDGFPMLNIRVDTPPTPDHEPGEYKMKVTQLSGDTFESPFDGETRRVWEVDIAMLYYDGQIDSDTFLVHFPAEAHPDDTLRVNYRIYSLVQEDFSPTLVMLDYRKAANTVQFPFKGMDSVWIAFEPGQVLDVSVDYPPVRMVRGVYTWGWRVHPPRIQFMQPTYEIYDQRTEDPDDTVLDPQSLSFIQRNRTEMVLDFVSEAAPEKKIWKVATAVKDGASPVKVLRMLLQPDVEPSHTWTDWADLVKNQTQLPPEAWEILADEEGLERGDYGDFNMITAFVNNETYGEGPFLDEIRTWQQGDKFKVKLLNLDHHTHYFRNVDFGARLHDDILRCCGGGETSFEIMNFKPSYGAPKVAEAQWRAGWGFRPHYDVIQQQGVFSRARDRVGLTPYTDGDGEVHTGFLYSEESRGGDFRFNPPPFVITDAEHPAEQPLRDADGEAGLLIGQFTEGYGVAQMCPEDPYPGFCTTDIAAYNPNAALNFPPPPLRGQPVFEEDLGKFPGDVYPDEAVELRWPPFLRNPAQGVEGAGDIIPPTGAWRPFLWINPNNGTLYVDPEDPSKGFWADLTYSHGAPVFAGETLTATVELPRASGQVFYQFDDLFHDNLIFSPHPVFAGFGDARETDSVESVSARIRRGSLRVQGELGTIEEAQTASWVTVWSGDAGTAGCEGTYLGSAPVTDGGRFVYRAQSLDAATDMGPGASVCVQSTAGGFAAATLGL